MAKNVVGDWNAIQSNGAVAHFTVPVEQQDGNLQATASHTNGSVVGTGNGNVTDTAFILTINWSDGTIGEYNGNFGLNGRLTGITFDLTRPQSSAFWHSDRTF